MLKRFYSKKSGFTLVEIVIAFAVFTLMSTMVFQILDLAVRARQYNSEYQRELEAQEQLLSMMEKGNYTGLPGDAPTFEMDFGDGTKVELPFDLKSVKDSESFLGGVLNYFVAGVDYTSKGGDSGDGGSGNGGSGGGGGSSNTGSQMARYDTRITGSTGFINIYVTHVTKDEHFDPGEGNHARYFIQCYAETSYNQFKVTDAETGQGEWETIYTMSGELVPFAQYRLFFYQMPDPDNPGDNSYIDTVKSARTLTDENGRSYTIDVHKEAKIVDFGYIDSYARAVQYGLEPSNIHTEFEKNNKNNKYTIEQTGANEIRIGSPFVQNNNTESGDMGMGVRFDNRQNDKVHGITLGGTSSFYVEFEEDPHIDETSFGYNAKTGTSVVYLDSAQYKPFPIYEYNSDGTPDYSRNSGENINIYGAYMPTRHYID